jgi:2-hydroxycyclohexanecarboxyl-CoA dehydrogenase
LRDKAAIVTGAAGAIGSAIAARLVRGPEGGRVFDLDATRVREVCAQLEATGGRAAGFVVDITDGDAVEVEVAACEQPLGSTEVLVNCAGIACAGSSTAIARSGTSSSPSTCSGRCTCRAVAARTAERKRGRIVNIASDAGRVGSSGEAAYAACKGGVIAFSKALARELAGTQINVNCVCPGPTDTPLLRSFRDEGDFSRRILDGHERAIPFRRLGTPADIAGIVAFLASDEASFIIGQVISGSGGLTMHG